MKLAPVLLCSLAAFLHAAAAGADDAARAPIAHAIQEAIQAAEQGAVRRALGPLNVKKTIAPVPPPSGSLENFYKEYEAASRAYQKELQGFGRHLACARQFRVHQWTEGPARLKPEAQKLLQRYSDEVKEYDERVKKAVLEVRNYRIPPLSDVQNQTCSANKGSIDAYYENMRNAHAHYLRQDMMLANVASRVAPYYRERRESRHLTARLPKEFRQVTLKSDCRQAYEQALDQVEAATEKLGMAVHQLSTGYVARLAAYAEYQRNVAVSQRDICRSIDR